MAKVTGIGGVFIKFQNPQKMKTWYKDILGLATNDYGVLFGFNHASKRVGFAQLGTFEANTDYFGSEKQQYMLNFRVDNLSELIVVLKKNEVKIVDEVEVFSYGKFLHIEDLEGNRIELWEPVDSELHQEGEPVEWMK